MPTERMNSDSNVIIRLPVSFENGYYRTEYVLETSVGVLEGKSVWIGQIEDDEILNFEGKC